MKSKFNFITLFFCLIFHIVFSQDLLVEKIWKHNEFSTARVQGFNAMKDGEHYTQIIEKEGKQFVTRHKIMDQSSSSIVLIDGNDLKVDNAFIRIDEYSFNEDETKVLIATQTNPIYRHSSTAVYYLFDLKTKRIQSLDTEHQPQSLASYSPDGTMVSFIYNNNLFVKNLNNGKVQKLTQDGERNKVINGTCDWVYEEEFGFTKAYEWSYDSKYIAYLKFNEKDVKDFTMTYYKDLYPEYYTYKYPKAGEDNSKVSAHIVAIKGAKQSKVDLGEYEYIPRLKWSSSANLLVLQTLNRHQNHLKYHLVDMSSKKMEHRIFFEETSKTYVDIDNNLHILEDGNSLLRTSESSGFNHIYHVTFDGKSTPVTSGNWDVLEFLGINLETSTIFYTAAKKAPIFKGVYSVNLNGTNDIALSEEMGYNDADFTYGMKYFVKTFSNANTPPVYTLCDQYGKEIKVLEDNQRLKNQMSKYNLTKKEFLKIASNDIQLNASMIKPPNFDPLKKYPVYITIYGGPGHNEVLDSWDGNDYMYHQLLAQNGYIVVSVDPRGTQYRGADFKKSTYLQLGKLECEDFINTAIQLQKFSYVDPTRIGIQGWSFGGFMTSLAMTKGAAYFKMGIAVAPVTNWKYYDNIYTERFMRTPKENPNGYEQNSPINFVNLLKGKYLLIHGSGDDNVHYQNTMEMINALVKSDKQFDLFIYPNKNHGIYGGNTRNHLFTKMFEYTKENL